MDAKVKELPETSNPWHITLSAVHDVHLGKC